MPGISIRGACIRLERWRTYSLEESTRPVSEGWWTRRYKNGTRSLGPSRTLRGGYYIDYDFGDVEVGTMGQIGIEVAVDGAGNFVTARFIY